MRLTNKIQTLIHSHSFFPLWTACREGWKALPTFVGPVLSGPNMTLVIFFSTFLIKLETLTISRESAQKRDARKSKKHRIKRLSPQKNQDLSRGSITSHFCYYVPNTLLKEVFQRRLDLRISPACVIELSICVY